MGETPVEIERAWIREVAEDFGQSAANLQLAGIDGVEIHGAHGYLVTQFLSPAFNRRTDEYGGTPRNRCRFAIELAEAVRERVGREYTLGMRLSYDEFIGDAGITPGLSDEYLDVFAGTGLFDYFNISCGSYHSLHYAVAPMGSVSEGFLVPYGERAKEVVGDRAKIFVVGRIRSLAMAERIVAQGAADMVAMMRMQIADPFHVRKTQEGREDEIVRCVGANECLAASVADRELTCTVNPAAGRERRWGEGTLRRAERPRRVVVVGGGPAGMRAAGTAARRGHDVVLLEREGELGGHLRLLSLLPSREQWRDAVEDLARPLERHGVDVRLGVEATARTLGDAEATVFATGATWDRDGFTSFRPDREGIPGADGSSVTDVEAAAWRALDDPESLGARVLVYDDTGTYLPLGLAEVLAAARVAVEVVTRHPVVGDGLMKSLDAAWVLPRLVQAGVLLTPNEFPERIDGREVELYEVWGQRRRTVEADTVVLAMLRTPADALYRELRDALPEAHRIGDCLAPRQAAEAIYEGEKLGRAL
jgi:hypothetical protein